VLALPPGEPLMRGEKVCWRCRRDLTDVEGAVRVDPPGKAWECPGSCDEQPAESRTNAEIIAWVRAQTKRYAEHWPATALLLADRLEAAESAPAAVRRALGERGGA
jgi:hypothetical protein